MYPFSELLEGQPFVFAEDIVRGSGPMDVRIKGELKIKTGKNTYQEDEKTYIIDDVNKIVDRLLTAEEAGEKAEEWLAFIIEEGYSSAEEFWRLNEAKILQSLEKLRKPVYDRDGQLIMPGDILDVQKAGKHIVFEEDNELWFTPYGKHERVRDYLRNDIVLVENS